MIMDKIYPSGSKGSSSSASKDSTFRSQRALGSMDRIGRLRDDD